MKKHIAMLAGLLACTLSVSAVTFKVKVPPDTQKCYVCGSFNNWNEAEAPEMESAGQDLFSLTLDEVTDVSGGYKYLCGRSWDYVEKDSNGDEIEDRKVLGDPDVVGSWRGIPEYNIDSFELTVNNIKRLIKVYLPEQYDEQPAATFPVIYYNTVQQRFSNAGADGDAGDYFFGPMSWNAHRRMEEARGNGGRPYIMVQVCSFLGENTPETHPDYIGTGGAAEYLTSFASELMPAIEGRYRVAKGAENTVLVGADYGGVFSVYAALTRPDLFGTCVSMSPMLWVNEGVFDGMGNADNSSQTYYISAGEREPSWMIADASELAAMLEENGLKVHFTVFAGGLHNDESWGEKFPHILEAALTGEAPRGGVNSGDDDSDDDDADFASRVYEIYGASNTDYVRTTKKGTLEYTEEYCRFGTTEPVKAMVYTLELGTSYNNKTYYWNVAEKVDETTNWISNSDYKVSFSEKMSTTAWVNVAVLEDGTVETVNANSEKFRVMVDGTETAMKTGSNYEATATVNFPAGTKSFCINYGSVNSGSLMTSPELTGNVSVSENCTSAEITYNFHLNRVTVKETAVNGVSVAAGEIMAVAATPFADRTYTLYGGTTKDNLTLVGTLEHTANYCPKGTDTEVEAYVYTVDIPAENKSYYYWNLKEGESDEWVMSSPKDVSFSNSKTQTSWLNIAVYENGDDVTIENTAANSGAFRVVTKTGKTDMTPYAGHVASATVDFPGADKKFTVNFGSVNSGTDMGEMTPTLSVGTQCVEARIEYNFGLNRVTLTETKTGDSFDAQTLKKFTAVPAVCNAGADVRVNFELGSACDVAVTCKKDFKTAIGVTVSKDSETSYHIDMKNVEAGMYTFTVSLTKGENTLPNAGEINVRVLADQTAQTKKMTVNAYSGIDWATTGRYKGNFHTHTSQSFDTEFATSQVVDRYAAANYDILALTDHDANPYPWELFDLYNPEAESRSPEALGILAIPGNELSKDRRNNWSESTGGEFNHHNDFFTGRQGQEFMSLRESYAYTEAIGGLQIINHPGQYWNRSTEYKAGEKNSPEWHAENFTRYSSLIGLEVYNQGNRREHDRILWDQILTLTMPGRPVWGYSCDDTHTAVQYFRNYQYMLMPEKTVDALREAMRAGTTVFSYEYSGSGEAMAPHINSISVDEENQLITIDTDDADKIEWIYSTHRTGSTASTTESTVIGTGNTFDYTGYQGSYVRARLLNEYGETATQPFGFDFATTSVSDALTKPGLPSLRVINDQAGGEVTLECTEAMERVTVINGAGMIVRYFEPSGEMRWVVNTRDMAPGVYVVVVATETGAYTGKFVR